MSRKAATASPGVSQALCFGDPASARERAGEGGGPTASACAAWRRLRCPDVGVRSLHPSQCDEAARADAVRCEGRLRAAAASRSAARDHAVEDVLGCSPAGTSGVSSKIEAQRERHYASHRRMPLGRVPEPTFDIPRRFDPNNYAFPGFGISTKHSESAKTVISAQAARSIAADDGDSDSKAAAAGGWVDRRSGVGCRAAPRGRPRGTDLAQLGIDESRHVFGKSGPRGCGEGDSTAECLKMADVREHATRLVPAVVAAANELSPSGRLGSARRSELSAAAAAADAVYGKPSPPKTSSVGSCMRQADVSARACDAVGTPVTRVGALIVKPRCDEAAVYGAPTVRVNECPPRHRRTDDSRNFGEDVSAAALVRGGDTLEARTLFLRPMARTELRCVLGRCGDLYAGVLTDDALFEELWGEAVLRTRRELESLPRGVVAQLLDAGAGCPSRAMGVKLPRAASRSPNPTLPSNIACVNSFRAICEERGI